jgi:hypothetical protein
MARGKGQQAKDNRQRAKSEKQEAMVKSKADNESLVFKGFLRYLTH